MNAEILQEPELEFGAGGRHVDIRFGLMNYGPLDLTLATAPKQIRIGVIGTPESSEGVLGWIDRCRAGVSAKESKQPNLFPRFPGFGGEASLHADIVADPSRQRTLREKDIADLCAEKDDNTVVREAADLFLPELRAIVEKGSCDVLVCAVPFPMLKRMFTAPENDTPRTEAKLNFHDLLKASAMKLGMPLQLVVPSTYDDKKRLPKSHGTETRALQDPATRAWNLYVAMYYKAGGVPWRLIRDAGDLTVCFVGVSFYETLDAISLSTSTAQVFNERGEGIVLRGEPATISKDDRQPHLDRSGANDLLVRALRAYRGEHKTFPARVVLYKTSAYSSDEHQGFADALATLGIESADLLNIGESHTRVLRVGEYPPLRGTLISKDEARHTLYSRGSVDFYETYPGMYIPHPIGLTIARSERTPHTIAQELLGLSKLNWNNTQFDNAEPIVLTAARKVGRLLKYLPTTETPQTRYSFYM